MATDPDTCLICCRTFYEHGGAADCQKPIFASGAHEAIVELLEKIAIMRSALRWISSEGGEQGEAAHAALLTCGQLEMTRH